ncbi:hypothetical protein C8Q76DRAFT_325627 [Earliella scabrosa]|nr:hypothetical protein C8Q76DRAFT_325627 [Earliella scabrosa]
MLIAAGVIIYWCMRGRRLRSHRMVSAAHAVKTSPETALVQSSSSRGSPPTLPTRPTLLSRFVHGSRQEQSVEPFLGTVSPVAASKSAGLTLPHAHAREDSAARSRLSQPSMSPSDAPLLTSTAILGSGSDIGSSSPGSDSDTAAATPRLPLFHYSSQISTAARSPASVNAPFPDQPSFPSSNDLTVPSLAAGTRSSVSAESLRSAQPMAITATILASSARGELNAGSRSAEESLRQRADAVTAPGSKIFTHRTLADAALSARDREDGGSKRERTLRAQDHGAAADAETPLQVDVVEDAHQGLPPPSYASATGCPRRTIK